MRRRDRLLTLPTGLLDWLLPPRCLLCAAPSDGDPARDLCATCAEGLGPPEPRCTRCGRVRAPGRAGPGCPRCLGPRSVADAFGRERPCRRQAIDGVLVAWRYQGAAGALVRALKFSRFTAASRPLARGLVAACRAQGIPGDFVVPVPLAAGRRLRRGFDQAEVLARRVARELDLPIDPRALLRVRATTPQSRRRGSARLRGLAGCFQAPRDRVAGRCVLLVDDVLTTGATAHAAAQALRRAGAAAVHLLVACRSEGGRARAKRGPRRALRAPSSRAGALARAPEDVMDNPAPVVQVIGTFVDDVVAGEVAAALGAWLRWILDGSHGDPPPVFDDYGVPTSEYAWRLDDDVDWEMGPHARALGDEVRIDLETHETHLALLGLLRRLGARTTRAVRGE
ncbi:MAG: double zinc ribbon domain-containing protein [Planctomycetota bacterium]